MSHKNLIPVSQYLKAHPWFKGGTLNNALTWWEAAEESYLIDPCKVDAEGWCDTLYYKHPGPRRGYAAGLRIGMDVALMADLVKEIEPGLFELWFD